MAKGPTTKTCTQNQNILLLPIDLEYQVEQPSPDSQEHPDHDHLNEENAAAVLPVGQRVKNKRREERSDPHGHSYPKGNFSKGIRPPGVVQVKDVQHNQVEKHGEGARTCVNIESVYSPAEANPRGNLGGQ